jgi:hypothetical protein
MHGPSLEMKPSHSLTGRHLSQPKSSDGHYVDTIGSCKFGSLERHDPVLQAVITNRQGWRIVADSQSNNLPNCSAPTWATLKRCTRSVSPSSGKVGITIVTYTSVWTYIFAATSPATWVQAEQPAHVPQAADEGMKGPEAAAIKRAMA